MLLKYSMESLFDGVMRGGGGELYLDFWFVLTHDFMSPTPMILCPPPKVFNQKYYETNKIQHPMKKKNFRYPQTMEMISKVLVDICKLLTDIDEGK